ncbi:ExeM/NucH family extracellular endonuclease [Nesterenkonia sp. NBAIMH1]|uniref:ExeM/NucH family extracellular endonuclease n=1 Tax=Nesterenkonia sp. NBAIMH1 TaxID=2600320 RepID=UPI0011B69202|nr:ExeM/NucH family extracellular endonuclease [Nesterenkonia sp. NBAIMH1]
MRSRLFSGLTASALAVALLGSAPAAAQETAEPTGTGEASAPSASEPTGDTESGEPDPEGAETSTPTPTGTATGDAEGEENETSSQDEPPSPEEPSPPEDDEPNEEATAEEDDEASDEDETDENIQSIEDVNALIDGGAEDEAVTTSGVVTGVYPDERSFGGFYIQSPETGDDSDYSDAIFVYAPTSVDDVQPGDYVEITGDAGTYNDQPQISLFPGSDDAPHHELALIEDENPVVEPAEIAFPETSEERDAIMGMLIEPQGTYTVTDHYTLHQYGEIGIVAGEDPLFNPTSVVSPGAEANARAARNSERLFYLDDGSTADLQNSDLELPYITADSPVRVGAQVSWEQPVIVDYDHGEYRLQPTSRLDGPEDEATPASFENTRTGSETPAPRAADLRIAGFNVLNYFVHLGEDEPGCDFYADRDGSPTTADWCEVRGAWSTESFERQQSKIVSAINAMDADMVALQEMENSGHFHQQDRDYAHAELVDALNADLGYEAWDYVVEPENVPSIEDEDVIRNGYIYKPEALEVIDSWILFDEGIEELDAEHFESLDRDLADIYSNAREPFAVQFQPTQGGEADQFLAIVNHFKSKGASGVPEGSPNADQGDGQAPWNLDRIHQAEGVQAFADALSESTGVDNVHLMGDFNSYEQEDPLRVFFDQGYTNVSAATGQHSYMFDAEVGSLDHLISSPSAADTVARSEIWQINAVEPIALEYSRFNSSASDLFRTDPWRSSDHDPIVADIRLTGEPRDDGADQDEDEDQDDDAVSPGPTDQADGDAGPQSPAPDASDSGDASVTLSPDTVTAGEQLTVSAGGYGPGEELLIAFNPELGEVPADEQGAAETQVTIPEETEPGTYTVEVTGQDSGIYGSAELTVTAPAPTQVEEEQTDQQVVTLARTGATVGGILLGAIILLGAGAALVALRAREDLELFD